MYQQTIREILAKQGKIGTDPRHVEAFMRMEHPTLDGLTRSQFEREVAIGAECVEYGGEANAEACAQSLGL